MAWCEVRRQKRTDPEEPCFIEVDPETLGISLCTADYAVKAADVEPMSGPPDPPEESTTIPGTTMPRMLEAWRRAAASAFTAGTHGPVAFPLPPLVKELPAPSSDKVFISSNFRPTSSLPLEHQAFLAAKTAKEVIVGSVAPVTDWSQVRAIMPTFVAVHPTTGKLRIIFDARPLNKLLRDSRGVVRYDDVRMSLQRAMCATKLDVEGAFRHVKVEESQQRYLCFEVAGRLYRYTCLPFGVSWSPALFLDAIRPVVDAARSEGIRVVWYMDDFLVIADDPATLDEHGARLIDLLMQAGWQPAADKVYPYAFSEVPFLGLLVVYATAGPYLSVPLTKSRRIRDEATAMIARGVAHVSDLQKVCGRLNFARIVAPQLGFLRRGLDAATAAGLRAFHGAVPVTGRLADDLRAVAHAAATLHTCKLGLDEDAHRRELGRAYSDASATGWGVLHLDSRAPVVQMPPDLEASLDGSTGAAPRGWTAGDRFSEADCALSSGAREVRAVVLGIGALNLRNGHIAWHCDATVAVFCITAWSSRSDGVTEVLVDLWDVLQQRALKISVTHVFRDASFMPVADWLSRQGWRDAQAEWAVHPEDFRRICGAMGVRPTADLFASSVNRRCPLFCSRWMEPGSIGDAFHVPWNGRVWWAFPPRSQLERFVTRLRTFYRQSEAAQLATTSPPAVSVHRQSSSSSQSPSAASFAVVLLFPDLRNAPFSAAVADVVRDHASRTATVFAESRGTRQLCPAMRLMDNEGQAAPNGPPWPLRVACFHVVMP
jgi:hypothetical protein